MATNSLLIIKKNSNYSGIQLHYDGYFIMTGINFIQYLKNPTIAPFLITYIYNPKLFNKSCSLLDFDYNRNTFDNNNIYNFKNINYIDNLLIYHNFIFDINSGLFKYIRNQSTIFSINLYRSNIKEITEKIYNNRSLEILGTYDDFLEKFNINKKSYNIDDIIFNTLNIKNSNIDLFRKQMDKNRLLLEKKMYEANLKCNSKNFKQVSKEWLDKYIKIKSTIDDKMLYKYMRHFKTDNNKPSIDKRFDKIVYNIFCISKLSSIYNIDLKSQENDITL